MTKSRIADSGVGAVQVRVGTVARWSRGQLGPYGAPLVVILHELDITGYNALNLIKELGQ